jgi:DNA primase large subunit
VSQAAKYHLSLAGEYFVAAELNRRGIRAAVTFGNAKSADVIASSPLGLKSIAIEVKSARGAAWVIGSTVPPPSKQPWVFVHVPSEPTDAVTYYILLQSELHEILTKKAAEYLRSFRERRGREFDKRPVWDFKRSEATAFEGLWGKVLDQLRDEWVRTT